MSEYITLLGSEQVQRAAHSMQNAAGEMQQAVSNFEDCLHRHRLFMDDWLERLGEVMKAARPQEPAQNGEER